MLAIDTNVVVRFLTRDDPRQAAAARRLVEGHDVFVGDTVWLETEWVLRSVYGFDARQVCRALRDFAGLPSVRVEDPAILARALDLAVAGLDFSDALHVTRAQGCDGFRTFDKALISAARSVTTMPVERP